MRIDDKGLPIHDDAQLQDPPAHLPRGQLLRRRHARHAGPAEARRRRHVPGPADRDAGAVRPDPHRAADRHARRPQGRCSRSTGARLKGRGAKGYNDSIPYWEPAYRDSAIVADATLGESEHDLSDYIDGAGGVAAALDRNREQLKALITDFDTHGRGVRARGRQPRGGDRRAAAHAARRPPALGALNRLVPGAARASPHDLRPGVRSRGPTIDAALPLRQAAARPRRRARAARPARRPAPDRAGAGRAHRRRACRSSKQVPPAVELPERGDPAVAQGQLVRRGVPGRPGRCTRRRRSRSRASPARAAPVTPTASGSACSPPAARTSSTLGPASSPPPRCRSSAPTRRSRRSARR